VSEVEASRKFFYRRESGKQATKPTLNLVIR